MKNFFLTMLFVVGALNLTSAHAGDIYTSKPTFINVANVEIELGRFFGLFAKNTAELEIKMTTKNAYDFEGRPVTDIEKANMQRIDDYLKNSIADIVSFQKLTCTYEFDEIVKRYFTKMHDTTGLIKAKYNLKCNENLEGHMMIMNFSSFKNIERIRAKVESIKATRYTIAGNQGTVKL